MFTSMRRSTVVTRLDILRAVRLRGIIANIAHHQQAQFTVHHALEQHRDDTWQIRTQLLNKPRLFGELQPELGRL